MSKHGAFVLSMAGALLGFAGAAQASVDPHRSEKSLPSSNGHAAIAYDATTFKLSQFLEHPYRFPHAGAQTRNFAFDSYPGLRIGSAGTWLNAVAPSRIEYLDGTGVIHTVRAFSGLVVDEYHFAPIGLSENASVMLVKVTRASGSGAIDAYSLFNYHVGSGSPLPGNDSETIGYSSARDALYESGPSGVAFGYGSIGASAHHGSSPQNPYASLQSGANLADNAGSGGAITDAVAGLQSSLGDLAVGQSAWAGWFTVLAPDAQAEAAVDRVRSWISGRAADKLLADETSAWAQWIAPAPSGASALEASLARQSQAILRMGQVAESGAPNGQLLASVAPGQWNIAWVRDMAYATVALVRTGHFAEAKAALAFQMQAKVGNYQQYVGAPYQISVVRYFGDGSEESDSNADGPNVEFDGFGLFLWSLDEYVRASNDTASLTNWWPAIQSKIADVLVKLQEPSGLIAADSSIWEVHWNGRQRHFAYTTITAANGLCAAAHLAAKANDATKNAAYLSAGQKARDALLTSLRTPSAALAQSSEGIAAGTGFLDAAVIEAINFGLIDPSRRTARASLASLKSGLVPPSGRGFMRSDVGDWYSSQEWIFVDMRAGHALALNGDLATSHDLFQWNVDQASENFGEVSELHDRVTADYAGESPMVGFGAGAYLIALSDRGKPVTPTCGAFASEPADPVDAGDDGSLPGSDDGGSPITTRPDGGVSGGADAGAPGNDNVGSSGGCSVGAPRSDASPIASACLALALAVATRRRRAR